MQSIIDLLHRAEQTSKSIFACVPLPEGAEGMTIRQYAVLAAIGKNPGVIQTVIGSVTNIDRSTLAGLVRRLDQKGLVRRIRTKEDTRAYSVSLTKKGESMVAAIRPVNDGANERLLGLLPAEERAAFLSALEKLASVQLSAYTI